LRVRSSFIRQDAGAEFVAGGVGVEAGEVGGGVEGVAGGAPASEPFPVTVGCCV
jgi:hypothetical protein